MHVAAVLAAFLLAWPGAAAAGPVIAEFLANNTGALRDEDGDASDWIEILNDGAAPVNLADWTITDAPLNLRMWAFPATNLAAGARLVVFASGKNRAVSGRVLHTNFRLDAGGGYVGLVPPGGTTAASAHSYRQQFPGISCGTGVAPSRRAEALVGTNAALRYVIPPGAVSDAWRGLAYTERGWSAGAFPAGYDLGTGAVSVAYGIAANTADNQGYSGGLGLDFTVVQPVQITALGCFDDGSDGIVAGVTLDVQLWQRNDQGTPSAPGDDTGVSVLASQTFTASAPGALTGGHRFKPLATPLSLAPGAYTIAAYGYGATERNGNGLTLALNSAGKALQFVGRSRYGGTPGTFPPTVDAAVAQYGAGTFKFQAVGSGTFATSLLAMRGVNASVLVRVPFQVPAEVGYRTLVLDVTYDDGFVAWLNGTEIARHNAPDGPAWDATATGTASGAAGVDVSAFAGLLQPGANVLALQGLNADRADADFRLDATLAAERGVTNQVYFLAPTPGAANGPGVRWPQVVINEIHSDPPNAKSVPAEFVELYNPLPTTVDLSGWQFTRGVTCAFPAGARIAPLGYAVVAASPPTVEQVFGVTALGPWTGGLANAGETLELQDAAGAVVDRVAYGLGFPWPTVGEDPGASLQLLHEGLDHELGGSWRSAAPTPGRRNLVTTGDTPPQIRQVAHAPLQPAGGQAVAITAKVSDPDAVGNVSLAWQVVEPGHYVRLSDAAFTNDASWVTLAMRDHGADGDAVAGDAVFTAVIPAGVQVHRRLIRYRLEATDSLGNRVRVPYADDPSPNFAYFVYDGVPAWTGAVRPGVTPASVFGTNVMRKVQPLHLISHADDVFNSQYNTAYAETPYQFEGAVVAGGVVYDHVRYRIAGENSTYVNGKNKWKFRFNRGHGLLFVDDYGRPLATRRETLKLSALTAPWAAWNRGLAGLDEAVAFRLSNLAGAAAPKTAYLQLRVIDGALESDPANMYEGDLWGLYLGFEQFDEAFKDEHGLADGNLFYMQSSYGNNRLAAQGAGQPDDLSDLNAFVGVEAGYNATPTQPLGWWRSHVDLPAYYSWRAVAEAVNDNDKRDQENVAYFHDPVTGLWSMHTWDVDLLYEPFDRWGPAGTQSGAALEQFRRCLELDALRIEFQNRARELQDLLLNADQAGMVVDECVAHITAGGPAEPGFVEVDRRMWDFNPLTRATGRFYLSPCAVPDLGLGPYPQPFYRTLASADFAGMVAWVKTFIVGDAHGGARLAALGADATIPATPSVDYAGPPGYPSDGLVFQVSAFSSPATRACTAVQWRLGEVYDPHVPGYVAGTPYRYESEPLWSSGELTLFNNRVAVPPAYVETGRAYRARARFKDESGRWSHWSPAVEFVAGEPVVARLSLNLLVTEIQSAPPPFQGLEGDRFEFLELRNAGTNTLDLSGLTFSAGITFAFPDGTRLAAGGTFLLARDAAGMALRYPGVTVHGLYAGRLADEGETLTLAQPGGRVVFSFAYGISAPWPIAPRGQGFALVLAEPRSGADLADAANWRASASPGGSPGADDPETGLPRVLINEVLAHTDPPQADGIELLNPTAAAADIGGWFLSDDAAVPRKFRIAEGTTIPAGGYRVFTEAQFNWTNGPGVLAPFSLDSHGDAAYLCSGDGGTNLTGYSHGVEFGATFNGSSLGRHVNSAGRELFPLQRALTLNAVNAGPRVGPVVINEIQYAPGADGDEFVELRNAGNASVALYDPAQVTNTWRLRGLGYAFPPAIVLGPQQLLLLVGSDPAAFRARYAVPGSVQVLGPWAGALQDDGERLELQQPDTADLDGTVPYVTVEAVRYGACAPWPEGAVSTGLSLQRRNFAAFGDDPANWSAAAPTPGRDFLAALAPAIVAQPVPVVATGGQTVVLSVTVDGMAPLGVAWLREGVPVPGATSNRLVLAAVHRSDSGAYSALITNAFGGAESMTATLRVRVPQRFRAADAVPGGAVRITAGDADGGALAPVNLPWFEVQVSTNLAHWSPLPVSLALTNGLLRLEPSVGGGGDRRFWRVIER